MTEYEGKYLYEEKREYELKCVEYARKILDLDEQNKSLQEELEKWKAEWQEQVQKATDEGYARTMLQIENGKLKEQIEKMRDCLNRWYIQKSDKFTDSFYEQLVKDTEECLWSDAK